MITGRFTEGRSSFLDLAIESRRLDETIRSAIQDLARQYEAKLKMSLQAPKGGRVYGESRGRRVYERRTVKAEVFGKKVRYKATTSRLVTAGGRRASAPGQAPAVFTGSMLRSIRTAVPSKGKGYSARVFADRKIAFYRHFLEFGTAERVQRSGPYGSKNKRVGRVAPRPVFSPLQAALERELDARVARAVELFATFGR